MSLADLDAFLRTTQLAPEETLQLSSLVTELVQDARRATATLTLSLLDEDQSWTSVSLDDQPAPTQTPTEGPPRERYQDLGRIGMGGMGEVRRVLDRELNRVVARKTLHLGASERPKSLARFVEEAQATAQLQHPHIVPIYDIGLDEQGRVWFTMKEVRGRTLTQVIREVHQASGHRWQAGESGWTFRRTLRAFVQVCEAVGYGHSRGVVHRDLKPDNVMIGAHGETYVMDWGLAKVLQREDLAVAAGDLDPVVTDRAQLAHHATRIGTVNGTPMYMSPEQARGSVDQIDARSDVYGLGAMLFEILSGQLPFTGADLTLVLSKVMAGDVRPLPQDGRIPDDLAQICRRAMATDPADRFPSAAQVASEVQQWLDGARRRAQALAVVDQAQEHGPQAARLRGQAEEAEERGKTLLSPLPLWAPEEEKAPGWQAQDHATQLRSEADREELLVEQGLHAALQIDARLEEAHAALAERYLAAHHAAELVRDPDEMLAALTRLEGHVGALPADHAVRARGAAYLKGTGALTLVTEPPGAQVSLHRFEERNRRLVPVFQRDLGRTPVAELPLEMGSYLCRIQHPDHPELPPVAYPVSIGRGEHWHGIAPGETSPRPVRLVGPGELGPDDCYVPAGWFIAGGDPKAGDSLPRTPLWCEAMVFERFQVTNRRYIAFLDDLVAQGREEDALAWAPRERAGAHDGEGALSYGRDAEGRFILVPDNDGDIWHPDWPVLNVHWGCALAYSRWRAEREGLPWRLPGELEWEKAARGTDARWYPWGDFLDPSWACVRDSHRDDRRLPSPVHDYPIDVSVYGIRGMGGNAYAWCANAMQSEARILDGPVLHPPVIEGTPKIHVGLRRAVKGGHWFGMPKVAKAALRWGAASIARDSSLSFRVCRSL